MADDDVAGPGTFRRHWWAPTGVARSTPAAARAINCFFIDCISLLGALRPHFRDGWIDADRCPGSRVVAGLPRLPGPADRQGVQWLMGGSPPTVAGGGSAPAFDRLPSSALAGVVIVRMVPVRRPADKLPVVGRLACPAPGRPVRSGVRAQSNSRPNRSMSAGFVSNPDSRAVRGRRDPAVLDRTPSAKPPKGGEDSGGKGFVAAQPQPGGRS